MSYQESSIGQPYRERIPADTNTRERPSANTMAKDTVPNQQEKRYRSIFDVPANFFDACRVVSDTFEDSEHWVDVETLEVVETNVKEEKSSASAPPRWTCNTCKSEFETLLDQRSHFKSDIHRINVKLSIAGKDAVKEEDFDELTCDSFKDFDISSISGSEDEAEKAGHRIKCSVDNVKQKLFIRLKTGERISVWKCLFLNEYESVSSQAIPADYGGLTQCLSESEVVERLKVFINEPRGNSHLRVMLLVSGGHFAGCVFDGNSVVAHKTFHRYVVRAKAGKKQSSKDSSGRAAHSAGASLRRYNELALKKDIQELLSTWKDYFCASSCVFVYAPSKNYQMLFDGGQEHFSQQCVVRNIPLNVRRPTYKEALRIYSQLTQVTYEVDQKENASDIKEDTVASVSSIIDGSQYSSKEEPMDNFNCRETTGASQGHQQSIEACVSSESDSEVVGVTTPLHEAAQSADADKVLEHLEQGLDPCVKDERGRTPYMLANDKEVRNTFRRFMAANLNRWDWHAAKVPSALTKEMEESQAAKQAEKDAKKKARAKELKKLRKAREKKAQAEAATSGAATAIVKNQAISSSMFQGQSKPRGSEESIEVEREKRAAAAERRVAASAMAVRNTHSTGTAATFGLQPLSGSATDLLCTCCGTSLAGKVPFHRYNYKYCSTTCMHVHREFLEDGG